MKLWKKLVFVFLAVMLVAWLVFRHADTHAPVKEGTVAGFWSMACGVNVGGGEDHQSLGGTYPPRGEVGIYYIQGYHDQIIHSVPLEDLAHSLPEVIAELKTRQEAGELAEHLEQALNGANENGTSPDEVRHFLGTMRKLRLEAVRQKDTVLHQFILESEKGFDERWRRASCYRATLLFEFAWLAGLVVLVSIPWVRRSGVLGWSITVGLIPPLLFLPYFLGYIPYVFTSAFPAGGVFYPYTLIWFRGLPWTSLDTWLLQSLPQPFEPLTQAPGPMLSVSDTDGAGPVSICVLGVVLGLSVFGSVRATRYLHRRFFPSDGTSE